MALGNQEVVVPADRGSLAAAALAAAAAACAGPTVVVGAGSRASVADALSQLAKAATDEQEGLEAGVSHSAPSTAPHQCLQRQLPLSKPATTRRLEWVQAAAMIPPVPSRTPVAKTVQTAPKAPDEMTQARYRGLSLLYDDSSGGACP